MLVQWYAKRSSFSAFTPESFSQTNNQDCVICPVWKQLCFYNVQNLQLTKDRKLYTISNQFKFKRLSEIKHVLSLIERPSLLKQHVIHEGNLQKPMDPYETIPSQQGLLNGLQGTHRPLYTQGCFKGKSQHFILVPDTNQKTVRLIRHSCYVPTTVSLYKHFGCYILYQLKFLECFPKQSYKECIILDHSVCHQGMCD